MSIIKAKSVQSSIECQWDKSQETSIASWISILANEYSPQSQSGFHDPHSEAVLTSRERISLLAITLIKNNAILRVSQGDTLNPISAVQTD